eukprot:TRINITY_DN57385_c0_g1_i1.p1 TRINITY_DN57385_c0_g1~~TRINITY_DN57385_c0_g1_i1.p1  ORF type:complete len:793 (-),score=100.35 TRINITY_DN57385_c0_g1_i1:386-2764(-)
MAQVYDAWSAEHDGRDVYCVMQVEPEQRLNSCDSANTSRSTESLPAAFQRTGDMHLLRRWRWWHLFLMILLLATYGYALSVLDGRRQLTSAAWREILGELNPSSAKSAERLTEREVTPSWDDAMQADDVTKTLNSFQTFCRVKFGMDDHIPFYWRCNIMDVHTSWQKAAGLPLEPNMNCSTDFVNRHIVVGDDPRCVPWGDRSLELLSRLLEADGDVLGAAKTASIPPFFDEFNVHSGSPMLASIEELIDSVDRGILELKVMMNATLRQVASLPGVSPSILADVASPTPAPRSHWRLRQKGRKLGTRLAAEKIASSVAATDCDAIRAGCPSFKNAPFVDESEVPCRCFFRDSMQHDAVSSVCRNHHWGLLHLCRPNKIVVRFEIRRVLCEELSPPRCTPTLWFSARMTFKQIRSIRSSNEPSGLYSTSLKLDEGRWLGNMRVVHGIMGFISLGFIMWFLLQGPLWAVLFFPWNLSHLLALRQVASDDFGAELDNSTDAERQSLTSGEEESRRMTAHSVMLRAEFEERLSALIGGFGLRTKYMAHIDVLAENIAAILIVSGFIFSSLDTLAMCSQTRVTNGDADEMPTWSYMTDHFGGFQLVSEVLYLLFFDATFCHGTAWFILYVTTMLGVFESIEGLSWVPAILRLSGARLTHFFIAYAIVIFGFGLVIWIQFGARFVQFSTLSRAWYELFLLACGIPMHVFSDIHPYYDDGSFRVSCFLALYLVLVVTVGLNFFTTIILDAYNLAKHKSNADRAKSRIKRSVVSWLMRLMGVALPGQATEDSDNDFDPLG